MTAGNVQEAVATFTSHSDHVSLQDHTYSDTMEIIKSEDVYTIEDMVCQVHNKNYYIRCIFVS